MGLHIAVIWQRFLPYHWARVRRAHERLSKLGFRFTAIEVAPQDASYNFSEESTEGSPEHICCFPGVSYHDQKAKDIHSKVLNVLTDLRPDVVFCPATAFPEGMAAIAYRLENGKLAVMMDDAWEHTDRRGPATNLIKRIIHKNVDAVFIPAPSHLAHYKKLGFPEERVVFGVDVVDNDFFSSGAAFAWANDSDMRKRFDLPLNYFLYVGRFLSRKGLETLIEAFARYRGRTAKPWDLVLVGSGNYLGTIRNMASRLEGVRFIEPKFGDALCYHYGLARAMIVPSISDPWGLVINEGMASGLPIIASKGCGAVSTFLREGENGWTFKPGDSINLSELMLQASSLLPEAIKKMGKRSQDIIKDWSLDRFADGVIAALQIPRRPPAGAVSNIITGLWKGRVNTR